MVFIIFLVTVSAGILYSIISVLVTFYELNKEKNDKTKISAFKPVSILKPLKGKDDRLFENLESFFKLDWPEYELLFGVNHLDDPAIEVVEHLMRKYPKVRSKLIINTQRVGLNPKINNLYNIYSESTYDLILISDSNIRVKPDYLTKMVKEIQNLNIGLVTTIFRGMGAKTIGSIFENLHINTFISGSVLTIKKLFNIPVTIGKSMLIKKHLIDDMGGFSVFSDYLSEDHLLGIFVKKTGMEIKHSAYLIDNINEYYSFENFINRHVRWAKMRRNLSLLYYSFEILVNPVFISLLFAFISNSIFGLCIFIVVSILKIVIDTAISIKIESDIKWYYYFLIPLKDILIGFIWLIPLIHNRVNWRGNIFQITKGTRLNPVIR